MKIEINVCNYNVIYKEYYIDSFHITDDITSCELYVRYSQGNKSKQFYENIQYINNITIYNANNHYHLIYYN